MTVVSQAKPIQCWVFEGIAVFVSGYFLGQVAAARPTTGLESKVLMSATQSVVGELIHYPTKNEALVTAQIITLQPGAVTPWHRHPMPTFGYILDGEIEVDYGPLGRKTFQKGDALMEAMAHVHRGRNKTDEPIRALVVSIGERGQPLAQKADIEKP